MLVLASLTQSECHSDAGEENCNGCLHGFGRFSSDQDEAVIVQLLCTLTGLFTDCFQDFGKCLEIQDMTKCWKDLIFFCEFYSLRSLNRRKFFHCIYGFVKCMLFFVVFQS